MREKAETNTINILRSEQSGENGTTRGSFQR